MGIAHRIRKAVVRTARKIAIAKKLRRNREQRAKIITWKTKIHRILNTEQLEHLGRRNAPKGVDMKPELPRGFSSFANYGANIARQRRKLNQQRGKGKNSSYKLTGVRKE